MLGWGARAAGARLRCAGPLLRSPAPRVLPPLRACSAARAGEQARAGEKARAGEQARRVKRSRWLGLRAIFTRWVPLGSAVYVGWCYIRSSINADVSKVEIKFYELFPFRVTSRLWGRLAACELPVPLRPLVYGTYVRMFRVDLDEASVSDLRYYRSLSEFFTRPLREGARPVDPHACVSPCDGVILNCGPADSDRIEQVKGVTYSLEAFLGENSWSRSKDENYYKSLLKDKNNILHQCIIYLAPGDYHRFHSPCEWKAMFRRHFSGKLLSVNPWIAGLIPGLFCMNERAVYAGHWEHGFFSMTAVGATNVGSIEIFSDKDLQTNIKGRHPANEMHFDPYCHFKKGEQFGLFNMGSTIVLLFEAPREFEFEFVSGDRVRVGQALSTFSKSQRR